MKAWNAEVAEETRKQADRLRSLGWYHSIQLADGKVIPGLQTIEQLEFRVKQFPIPEDLRGLRVLDIGAWDGWFSFEMERRGAAVVAVDLMPSLRFLEARALLRSKVDYHVCDVYDLDTLKLGKFDIVLFFGVLYHLKHPLLGLERVCGMSTGMVLVESFVSGGQGEPTDRPIMEFYETTELCGQFDNWVGPNVACMMAMCRAAGFAGVSLESVVDSRAHVTCLRRWDPNIGTLPAPYIVCVENAESRNHEFSTRRDDYVSIWFKSPEPSLDLNDVLPEVGGYGVRPVLVRNTGGDGWQAVVKMPLGIDPGWTLIQIRTRGALQSNAVHIGVDVSEAEREVRARGISGGDAIQIVVAADGKSWERNRVLMRPDACLSLWVSGLPNDLSLSDVCVRVGGFDLPSVFVSSRDPAGLVQVNVLLPSGLPLGSVNVNVSALGAVTKPVIVEVLPGQPPNRFNPSSAAIL